MAGSSNFLGNLPVLDGKNWDRWCVQMKVIFGYQEVTEVVMEGFPDLGANPSETQHTAHRRPRRRTAKHCSCCINVLIRHTLRRFPLRRIPMKLGIPWSRAILVELG